MLSPPSYLRRRSAASRSRPPPGNPLPFFTRSPPPHPPPLAAVSPPALLQLRHSWHLRLKRRLTESPVNRVRPGPDKPPPREDGYNRVVRNLPLCPTLTNFCLISWKG